jgi:hypothetical protein
MFIWHALLPATTSCITHNPTSCRCPYSTSKLNLYVTASEIFHPSICFTYEAPMQEVNQICVVLTLYWVSEVFLMQLAHSYIWHTSFPIYNRDFTVFTVISTDVFHLCTPTMTTKQDMIPHKPHNLFIRSHIQHTNQLQYYYMR